MENEVVLEGEEPEADTKNDEFWLRGLGNCFSKEWRARETIVERKRTEPEEEKVGI